MHETRQFHTSNSVASRRPPPSRGAGHTFAWLEEELYALDEVVAFASKRLEGAADVLEQEFFR